MLNGPIPRRRLHQDVSQRIEALILRGELRPGDALPSEREMMAAFEVGRPAVREALLSLQKSGLVKVGNGERARVVAPTAEGIVGELATAARFFLADEDGVRHFQHARTLFESALARLAAESASPDDIQKLGMALQANEASIANPESMERTDVAFHYAIAEIARNPIFNALHEAIVVWLREQRATSLKSAGAARAAYEAHRVIFEAIARRDPHAAGAAMKAHLEDVERRYWSIARPGRDGGAP
jgi:DNA-binding FadR family transcriptional regulator